MDKCRHGNVVCSRCVKVSDAAKRMSDAVKLAVVFHPWDEIRHGWMAFSLADGNTDHVIYPSKNDAIRHVSDENRYAFVCLRMCAGGMSPADAQLWLDLHRHAHDCGVNTSSLYAPDLIFPLARNSGAWPA